MILCLLAVRSAHADPSAADKETARSLLNEGDRKRDAKDPKGALAAYRAADAIMGVPTTTIEVAKTEERLGMLVEARDTALRATRFPPSASEPRAYQQARAAAEKLAADLSGRVPSIQIKVRGAPLEVVTIEIDGTAVPKLAASAPRKVNPGRHVVVASAEGYESARAEVSVAERETGACELSLAPSKDGPPSSAGIAQPPGSADPNALVSTAPPAEGASTARSTSVSPLFYAGASVAAAGIAVGTVTGILELVQTSKAETTCASGQREACLSELDDAHRLATAANVSLAVGALGAATALFALLRSGSTDVKAAAHRTSLQLLVRPGGAGIAGTF